MFNDPSDPNYTEPNPADYGIMLGTDPCLDQCWENFRQCLRTTNDSNQCLAELNYCQQSCAPATVDAP